MNFSQGLHVWVKKLVKMVEIEYLYSNQEKLAWACLKWNIYSLASSNLHFTSRQCFYRIGIDNRESRTYEGTLHLLNYDIMDIN